MTQPEDPKKIIVDEDWKSQVRAEKEALDKEPESVDETPTAEASATDGTPEQLPPPTFAELVTIFATQASMSLQESANPENKEAVAHLTYAKHFIDLLAVLEEKTNGNLTPDEATMLDGVLHELRMAFVSLKK